MEHLPKHTLWEIFFQFTPKELAKECSKNNTFASICSDPGFRKEYRNRWPPHPWKELFQRDFPNHKISGNFGWREWRSIYQTLMKIRNFIKNEILLEQNKDDDELIEKLEFILLDEYNNFNKKSKSEEENDDHYDIILHMIVTIAKHLGIINARISNITRRLPKVIRNSFDIHRLRKFLSTL